MKLKVIGSEHVVNLLRLAGVEGEVADNGEQALQALKKALQENAVIMITYSLSREISQHILALSKERPDFVILEIPELGGEMPTLEETQKLLEESIGIKLR
jgi:vacuolar-type H+-ATPase subunit F/Vma7